MSRRPKEPTWPFLCILTVLFILSAAAPRAWEKTVRTDGIPAPNQDLVTEFSQNFVQERLPTPKAVEKTLTDLFAAANGAAAVKKPRAVHESGGLVMAVPSPRVAAVPDGPGHSSGSPLPASKEEVPPVAESPAEAVAAVTERPSDACDVGDVPGVSPIEPSAISAMAAAIPKGRDWLGPDSPLAEPASITALLEPLGWECGIGQWARAMAREVRVAAAGLAAESPGAKKTIERLESLAREGRSLRGKVKDTPLEKPLQNACEMIDRRILVWRRLAEAIEDGYQPAPIERSRCQAHVRDTLSMLATNANGVAWRRFLQLDQLMVAASRTASEWSDEERKLASTVLLKLHAANLSADQLSFVRSEPLTELRQCLHEMATERVRAATIVESVEAFERTWSAGAGERLAAERLRLALSTHPPYARLAECIAEVYCAPNVRIAVTGHLLNQMMPDRKPEYQWVRDSVMGHPVRGRSLTSAHISLVLIPDPERLRAALNVEGLVDSSTSSTAGPATFFSDSQSTYLAAKELELTPKGIEFQPAEVEVDNRTRLRQIRTTFDLIPLLGPVVHDLARNQHEKNRPQIRREVQQKVHAQAKEQIDEEVDARLGELNQRLKDRALDPLAAMSLRPIVTQAETTRERMTMQLQLAAPSQLGSHTPRPWAPADSVLSFQLHQSAVNNVIERLRLNGQTLSIKQLRDRIGERFHRPELLQQTTENDDVMITFAPQDAVRIDLEDGRLAISLAIERLAKSPHEWTDFRVRAYYRPVVTERSAHLVRDGVVELSGRIRAGSQITLRGIFSKTFSKDRVWPIVPDSLAADSRLAGLEITQLLMENGWVGLAIGPERAKPSVAERTRTATK